MNAADLCYTPATELAALIRAKRLSPVELTRAVLERIERLGPALRAIPRYARSADGTLHATAFYYKILEEGS